MAEAAVDVARQELLEKTRNSMEYALRPNSGQAIVFLADNGNGTVNAMFAQGTAESGEMMTYLVDGRVFEEPMLSSVAEGLKVPKEVLKKDNGFHNMLATSVAAAACSARDIPGVTLTGCSTRPLIRGCMEFAASNRVEEIRTVSVKQAKNISWRYGQAVNPKPVEKHEAGTLF